MADDAASALVDGFRLPNFFSAFASASRSDEPAWADVAARAYSFNGALADSVSAPVTGAWISARFIIHRVLFGEFYSHKKAQNAQKYRSCRWPESIRLYTKVAKVAKGWAIAALRPASRTASGEIKKLGAVGSIHAGLVPSAPFGGQSEAMEFLNAPEGAPLKRRSDSRIPVIETCGGTAPARGEKARSRRSRAALPVSPVRTRR